MSKKKGRKKKEENNENGKTGKNEMHDEIEFTLNHFIYISESRYTVDEMKRMQRILFRSVSKESSESFQRFLLQSQALWCCCF